MTITKPNFFSEGSPYLNHPLLTPERTANEIDFILAQIKVSPNGRILDVGCGPGRHSLELVRRGYPVVGIDPSPAMISAARQRAAEMNVQVDFRQINGEEFNSTEKFEAAICLFTTLGQINLEQDNRQLISQLAEVLKPGGYLVLEVPNYNWVVKNLKQADRIDHPNGYTLIARSFDPSNQNITEKFDVYTDLACSTYFLRYHLFKIDDLNSLLSQSGFHILATHGGYAVKPLDAADPAVVIIAQLFPKSRHLPAQTP